MAAQTGPGRSGNEEISVSKWDAIGGAKGRVAFGDSREWFVPWYLDVGAGQTNTAGDRRGRLRVQMG